ncbi:glycosyltransferase family 4 protein [Arthrobacter gyeryongensis]
MLEEFVDGSISTRGYPFPGTSELIIEYINNGHYVVLITTATDVTESISLKGPMLEIMIVPSRIRARSRALDLFAAERAGVKKAILNSNADVVHAHWTYEFGIASRASKIPTLVTVHDWGPAIARHNRHLYWYIRAAMQVWCLLIPGELSAPTSYLAKRVTKIYRRKCSVIPNGVDLSGRIEPDLGRTAGSVGMLNVGFTAGKNVRSALMAWRLVQKTHPTTTLHLAGPDYAVGGPAHAWAIKHGCEEGVVFEGPIDPRERSAWYRDKEIFLHTSREESFGLVLIEAMAAMTPVIAGKSSGAVPEITLGAARLIDIDNPKEIASHLVQLLESTDERSRLSSLGSAVAKQYDRTAVAKNYLSILHDLSSKPLSGPSA